MSRLAEIRPLLDSLLHGAIAASAQKNAVGLKAGGFSVKAFFEGKALSGTLVHRADQVAPYDEAAHQDSSSR
jgi:hypothetical protein